MVEVWRLYSHNDGYIEYELLYRGSGINADIFIDKYISRIKIIFPYYDRIYTVNHKNEIDKIDDYIDVKWYKHYLKNKKSCVEKIKLFFYCNKNIYIK